MKREISAFLEIYPTKEGWRFVEEMFGDQCATRTHIMMMIMTSFVECLDTIGVRTSYDHDKCMIPLITLVCDTIIS